MFKIEFIDYYTSKVTFNRFLFERLAQQQLTMRVLAKINTHKTAVAAFT